MSDTPSAFPPPPPGNVPPPAYQVAPSPLPNYQPPPMAQQPGGVAPQQPWQQPMPAVGAGWGAVGVLSQFGGSALWAIFIGAVTIVVPLFFNRVFFVLPIIGIIAGARAIQQGKLIGGVVGIVLSAIGGILTLIGLFG